MKKILSIFIIVVFFSTCEETIDLDVNQTQPVIVVEGLVTNQMSNHYVKISRSVGFYEDVKKPPVADATVVVRDNHGNSFNYIYNSEDSTYYSATEFEGVIGYVYSLEINMEDQAITATDTLKSVTPIDAVLWKIDEQEKDNPDKEGYFYEITLTAKEPKETVDYYLFHFYRNDSVQRFDNQAGVFFADDLFVKEDIDNFPAPVYYKEGDVAKFQMLSLSKFTYKYYNDLSFILNNDGGMFSSVPANPYTNLKGENVVGCFQVSSVTERSIVVGDPEFERKD